MITYKAVNALNKLFKYEEELLEFTNGDQNINVDEVLFESEYQIIKSVGMIDYVISKDYFVKDLELPYTEFDIN